MKKKGLIILAVFLLSTIFTIPALASDITVKLEKIVNEFTVLVDFDNQTPMSINNSTVVPLRRLCERAGLKVSWNSTEQMADISLKADENSKLPIEKYAFSLMKKANTKGLILTPDTIDATIKVNESFIFVRYNYKDANGEIISFGKMMETAIPITLVDEKAVVIPLRSLMETFGLWVDWQNNSITISIPPYVSPLKSLEIVTYEQFMNEVNPVSEEPLWLGNDITSEAPTPVVEPVVPTIIQTTNGDNGVPDNAVYIGNFKITHYCACPLCCGSYGNSTAWAGEIVPGVTIAVDPTVIPKLASVYIDGYGIRVAEDCGSAIKENKIDVAVATHEEAMELGVCYKDVWLLP